MMYAYTGMKVFYTDTGFTSARKKEAILTQLLNWRCTALTVLM